MSECFGLETGQLPDLEELLNDCAVAGEATPENFIRLADLFREGEIQRLRGDTTGAAQSDALALGLFLELLQTSVVSFELIQKTEGLIERTAGTRLPACRVEAIAQLLRGPEPARPGRGRSLRMARPAKTRQRLKAGSHSMSACPPNRIAS